LDGGQILRSLLWFVIGNARSQMVATVVGFLGVAGLLFLAIKIGSVWFGVMAVFLVLNCWAGLKHSMTLLRLGRFPRRAGFICSSCHGAPPMGNLWTCPACKTMFDAFELRGTCPYCTTPFDFVPCLECGRGHPLSDWAGPAEAAST
jgi:hypothetical protein